MQRVLRAALFLASIAAWSGNAFAQADEPTPEDIEAAGKAFDRGRNHFKAGEMVEAAEQFESADQAAPSSAALMLALNSRREAGQLDRAATLAHLALQRHPDETQLRQLAEQTLAETRGKFFELTVSCDNPCALVLGTRLVHGKPATERRIFLKPGKYSVRAGWGRQQVVTKEVQATEVGGAQLSFTQPPEVAQKDVSAEEKPGSAAPFQERDRGGVAADSSGWSPAVFWVGAGLTLVAGGVTAWSGIDTQNNPGRSAVKEKCAGLGTDCDLYQDGLSRQRRTNVLVGTTAGLGVVTLIIGAFLTDWDGQPSAPAGQAYQPSKPTQRAQRMSVQPWLALDNGATFGAVGSF